LKKSGVAKSVWQQIKVDVNECTTDDDIVKYNLCDDVFVWDVPGGATENVNLGIDVEHSVMFGVRERRRGIYS